MAEDRGDPFVISERTFARSFSGFWTQVLPLLTPGFVHIFNEAFVGSIRDGYGFPVSAVERLSAEADSALLAEFAFFLAKTSIEKATSVVQVFDSLEERSRALDRALITLKGYGEYNIGNAPPDLSESELEECLALAHNYSYFLHDRGRGHAISFNVRVPGAGFIPECETDLAVGSCLFEVKTVDRNIASKDIRQLLVYLALQAATGERIWRRAGFFNPRRALHYEFDVDELVIRMSGGKAAPEVFHEIVTFASSREIQLDTAF